MKEWIHPNHTSKGGPGDPLLERKRRKPKSPLVYQLSGVAKKKGLMRCIETLIRQNQ